MNEILSLKNIPQDLKFNGLWCGWKLIPDKGKVPYNLANDYPAKSNDPSTFVSYPVLLNNAHKYLKYNEEGKQIGGVGLGIFKGFSAIDIDHCVNEDGIISELAKNIINFCQSYTEYSPSGTGIRIIFKTNDKIDKNIYYINNHNIGLEIYISDNTNKFVTITGNKISGDVINFVNIKPLLDNYMKKNNAISSNNEQEHFYNGDIDIHRILQSDSKLNELWYNKAPGSHSNESELDAQLCCKLAYYCKGDKNKINDLFMSSPYYNSKDDAHKKKWDREDYRNSTINSAINLIGNSYEKPLPVKPVVQQSIVQEKKDYELNDTGNARRFIDMFGDIVKYNFDNNIWMIWNEKHWQYDIDEQIKNYVEIMAEQMTQEAYNVKDLITQTRIFKNIDRIYNSAGKESLLKEARHIPGIPITNDQLDKDQYLLCTDSGTINLLNGDIQKSKKSDLISMSTNCEIDLQNKPKLFLKFINEMFDGNEEIIHYVHKAFGYSITNSAREQCMFILCGDGNNGKSLLLDIIKCALGSYAITSKPQLLTEQKFGSTNSEEIARLKGKRFVPIEEIKEGDKLDEQLVKSLTSGIGNQVARFLYGNSFEFPFKGKLWMATNYEPVIRGTDKGIWRRIVKIPVTVDFTGREDRDLHDKLMNELPQILGWIYEGYQLYMKEGLEQPKEIKQATMEYRKEMDIVAQWINECCECKPSYFEKANKLYDNFRAFCQRRDQRTNQTVFGRNLGKKFKKINSGGIVYIGIRLKLEAEDLKKKVDYENIKVDDDI